MISLIRKAVFVSLVAATVAAQQPSQPYVKKSPSDPAHSQAEAIALGYMHTLLTAEKLYLKKHARYAPTLYALAGLGSGSFTKRMAKTDRGDYTVSYRGAEKKFALQLTPKTFDADHRAFWTNQDGIIHAETSQPATDDSPVLRPD